MNITAYDVAQRFVGMKEIDGKVSNPQILAMLQLDQSWPQDDEVPWCSGFMNYVTWLLRLPRSKSLMARSWLGVGVPITEPHVGYDIVILKRGSGNQPGPEILDAPGHVGFFAGYLGATSLLLLGGNQSNTVRVSVYPATRLLGMRRLYQGD